MQTNSSDDVTPSCNQLPGQSATNVWGETVSQTAGDQTHRDGSQNSVQCQVCEKPLSHLDDQRRLQHVNRCLDQVFGMNQHNCSLLIAVGILHYNVVFA